VTESAAVLVIEDESHARTLLQVTLRQEGYRCLLATNGASGVEAALGREPDLVLLDLGLPDLDGFEVTRRIRARSAVPIIVVSARDQHEEKIAALDEGANDYMTKPYVTGELLARMRVALRTARAAGTPAGTGTITVGGLSVDFDLRRVTVDGAEVHLTPTEYRLIGTMIRAAGRVLSHRQILREVWGPQFDDQMGYLRVYMKKLRYKIEPEPAQPRYLVNEVGVGYRLRIPG
jgi:two-component system KDP operon response regulator KdpE